VFVGLLRFIPWTAILLPGNLSPGCCQIDIHVCAVEFSDVIVHAIRILKNFERRPALWKHPRQHILDHLIPEAPDVLAGSFFVSQIQGQLADRVAEADVIGVEKILGATALI
jgi:hypothetical protein